MHYSIARRGASRLALVAAALAAAALVYGLAALAPAARASGPGEGAPWTVSLGDSYISGEAGRWAGNTNESSSEIDALGSTAYDDNESDTGELIEGCHRSKSAEVHIGGGVEGENLACSGAKTSSFSEEGDFKPGLDFYNSGGHEGQALMLQHFAAAHNVKLVAISIGGNNFNFASIVQTCVEDWLLSPNGGPTTAAKKARSRTTSAPATSTKSRAKSRPRSKTWRTAMTNAGYSASQYTILVQDYPSPIPNGSGFRYSQSGYTRQTVGGCGFWNTDANYANSTMLPTIDNAVLAAGEAHRPVQHQDMELSSAFNRHRLCEKGVGLLEEEGLTSWKQAEAVNKTEWINQIRTITAIFPPYEIQEDLHPNYWAQLGAAQLPHAGLQRRHPQGRHLHDLWNGPQRGGRAQHVAALRLLSLR